MYELPKRVQSHILPGEAQSLSQLVQCFGGWIFVCCLVYDNPDGLQGFTSREFAGRSSSGIKLANPSDTMLASRVHRLQNKKNKQFSYRSINVQLSLLYRCYYYYHSFLFSVIFDYSKYTLFQNKYSQLKSWRCIYLCIKSCTTLAKKKF